MLMVGKSRESPLYAMIQINRRRCVFYPKTGGTGREVEISGFDHIVLCARDVTTTRDFYVQVLNLDAREERPGKWALHFGDQKISLQQADNVPAIARRTTPGTGNFCLMSKTPIADIVEDLARNGVTLVEGPVERTGAIGSITSVYFYDPDGALVEIANRL